MGEREAKISFCGKYPMYVRTCGGCFAQVQERLLLPPPSECQTHLHPTQGKEL